MDASQGRWFPSRAAILGRLGSYSATHECFRRRAYGTRPVGIANRRTAEKGQRRSGWGLSIGGNRFQHQRSLVFRRRNRKRQDIFDWLQGRVSELPKRITLRAPNGRAGERAAL